MKAKTEPDIILCNFLRKNLTDVNANRVGNWIFPDFPRIKDLGNASFPRIGITILSEEERATGIYDDTYEGRVVFQIDVVSKKDQLYNIAVTNETLGTVTSTVNNNRLTFDYLPNTSKTISISHNGTAYATISGVSGDEKFTSPASLTAGTVQYGSTTGNINFSATDVTNHDGESITGSYTYTLSGKDCCQHLARSIKKEIMENWRSDVSLHNLHYPEFINNTPVPFDEDLGIYRQVLEIGLSGFNIGRGL